MGTATWNISQACRTTNMLAFSVAAVVAFSFSPIVRVPHNTGLAIHEIVDDDESSSIAEDEPCGRNLACPGCTCGMKDVTRATPPTMRAARSIIMSAVDDDTAIFAQKAASAAATAAEQFAVKGG